MKETNKLVAILAMIIIGISTFALTIQPSAATDPTDFYRTTYGNLATDTYSLYPYQAKSLSFGLSKFGELLDGNTKIGMAYGTTDPFGPDGGSPPEGEWIEGWVLNVTYIEGGQYVNLWAIATYADYRADGLGIGGDWHENVTVGSTGLSVRGGRKTNAGATTDPLQVLYDGPREFIAMARTTIYETPVHVATNAILNLTFTFIFNKVSKQVEILKDIKRIDVGKDIGNMQIEFGDRGEWDLGAGNPPKSYAHVFRDYTTSYTSPWQPWYNTSLTGYGGYAYNGSVDVVQIIDNSSTYAGYAAFWPKPITTYVGATQMDASRDLILTSTSTVTEDHVVTSGMGATAAFWNTSANITPYPQQNASGIFWVEDPMVFLNGQYKVINGTGDASTWVYYCRGNHTVIFPPGHLAQVGDTVRLVYKTLDKNRNDMSFEPDSPFVIGEWAFEMDSSPSIFRGVTVYGLTDLHDGTDTPPNIDREVQYLLDSVFNPWDLQQAVEKKTDRWVQYYTATSSTWVQLAHRPVINVEDWDQYNEFTERVEDLTTGVLLHRLDDDPLAGSTADYAFSVNATTGYANVSGLTLGHHYKILYSTDTYVTHDTAAMTAGSYLNRTYSNITSITSYLPTWDQNDTLNVDHYIDVQAATFTITNSSGFAQNATLTLDGWLENNGYDLKVFKENPYSAEIYDVATVGTGGNSTLNITLTNLLVNWTVTPPYHTDVHLDWYNLDLHYSANVTYWTNGTLSYYNVTTGFTFGHANDYEYGMYFNGLYMEHIPGRYEWTTVGRDAASVDSAGAALVSAAFKNKQVEIGLAGEDMYDTVVYNQIPFVMNRVGTATETLHTYTNYYYNNYGTGYTNDYRVALRDDWCTTWPITTSNMIAVGGPIANMLSYYENDFSPAFAALGGIEGGSQFTNDTLWKNHIVADTCWNAHSASHVYSSSNTTGYGIISTYIDLNGTEVLQIWGDWGRDTYYLTKWFHEVGIYQLQDAPSGLTAIIVKITYGTNPEGYKPTGFSIVECLGTISERLWIHGTESKGGIHDP